MKRVFTFVLPSCFSRRAQRTHTHTLSTTGASCTSRLKSRSFECVRALGFARSYIFPPEPFSVRETFFLADWSVRIHAEVVAVVSWNIQKPGTRFSAPSRQEEHPHLETAWMAIIYLPGHRVKRERTCSHTRHEKACCCIIEHRWWVRTRENAHRKHRKLYIIQHIDSVRYYIVRYGEVRIFIIDWQIDLLTHTTSD